MSGITISDMIADLLTGLEGSYADAEITPENRESHFDEMMFLRASMGRLRDLTDDIDKRIAATFEKGEKVALGDKLYEAKRSSSRKKWDKDLKRAVLDSVVADPETGEILPETPLDKILAVWNLGSPRTTVLEARGIDPDEWSEVEWKPATLVECR